MRQGNFQIITHWLVTTGLLALVVVGVFVQVALPAFAVDPDNVVAYQGRVLNSNGVPVAVASADMQFSFWDSLAAGTCLWSNDDSGCASTADITVTLTEGLFSVNLGDTGDGFAAIPDSVFADDESVYLEVIIEGETLTPRKRVVAAPYAINSQTLDGLDSTAFLDTLDDAYNNFGATDSIINVDAAEGQTGNLEFSMDTSAHFLVDLQSTGDFKVQSGGTDIFVIRDTTRIFHTPQDIVASATTTGIIFTEDGGVTITDDSTPAAGTNPMAVFNFWGQNTIAATNAGVTTTDASTLYIEGEPLAGTNNTITNSYALWVDSGDSRFDGDIIVAGDNIDSFGAPLVLNDVTADEVRIGSGTPGVATGDGDLYVSDDLEVDGDMDLAGTLTAGDLVCTDCLDFDTFEDTLDLDASTMINMDGAESFTLTNGSTADYIINLTSSGDFIVQDGGSPAFRIADNSVLAYTSASTTDGASFDLDSVTTGIGASFNSSGLSSGELVEIGSANAFSGSLLTLVALGAATGDILDIASTSATATAAAININLDNGDNDNDVFVLTTDEATSSGTAADTVKARITASGEFLSDVGFTAGGASTEFRDGSITKTNGGTFDFNDASGAAITLEFGGVTADLGNTVSLATNSTTSDTITIGNNNASTTLALTGGDDWNIAATGDAVFEDVTIDMNGATTTNGVCHSGADSDTTAAARDLVVCSAAPDDYAEWYETEEDVDHGDIVAFSDSMFTYQAKQSNPFTGEILPGTVTRTLPVLKKAVSGDLVFGVVSTSPNQIIGSDVKTQGAHPMPIALTGRVPAHVSDENGAIAIGDYLTISSTSGHVMKAVRPGHVVGRALANFSDPGTGTIMMFVDNGWWVGTIGSDEDSTIVEDHLAITDSLSLRGTDDVGTMASMNLMTTVIDPADYRLSIRNGSDVEVVYVTDDGLLSVSGDMVIGGKLYPSDRGIAQTSKYIYYDGDTGLGGDFMRTNASGWATGSYDFAEMFPSSEELAPGQVVVFDSADEHVKRSSTAYDRKVAGIVSTRPGFLAGENVEGHYPVALAGRVPTNVTDENGPIAVGDPLTTSGFSGAAMKATEPGPIVGYALEPYAGSGSGRIIAFVNVGYWSGEETSDLPATENDASQVEANHTDLSVLNMGGDIFLNAHDIIGVRQISGLSDRWVIEEDGTIKTEASVKTLIRSYRNEVIETTVVSSRDAMVTLVGTGELQNGQAVIDFDDVDPTFADITSTVAPIRVIATPNGPVSLYVSEKSNDGFTVRQIGGSDNGIAFDWMVSAYRKDYEPEELLNPQTEQEESQDEEPVDAEEPEPEEAPVEVVQEPPAEEQLPEEEQPQAEELPVEEPTEPPQAESSPPEPNNPPSPDEDGQSAEELSPTAL